MSLARANGIERCRAVRFVPPNGRAVFMFSDGYFGCVHIGPAKKSIDKNYVAVIAAKKNVLFHLFSIAIRVMRVSIAICEAPEQTVKFHLDGISRMLQLTQ